MKIHKVFYILILILLYSCDDNPNNNAENPEAPVNNLRSDTSALSLLPTILATIDLEGEFTNDHIDIDSLLSIISALPSFGTTVDGDTSRISILNQISVEYELTGFYDGSLHYANEALILASGNTDKFSRAVRDEIYKGEANALHNIGIIHYNQGNYPLARKFYMKSLKIREQLGNKKGIADCYNRIGNVYKDRANYPLAMDYYQKSLAIREKLGDKKGIAYCYNDIGNIYDDQGNPHALEYHLKSFKIRSEIDDKRGLADTYNNIGIYYKKEGADSLALKFYLKSFAIRKFLGDKKGIADSYNNIAIVYMFLENYSLAMEYSMKSLKIIEELNDMKGMSYLFANIGTIYQLQHNDSLAMEYYEKSFKIKEELGDKLGMSYIFNCRGWLALEIGNYEKAIENSKRGLALAKEIGALPNEEYSNKILNRAFEELSPNVYGVYFQEFSVFINEKPLDSVPIEYYRNIQEGHEDTAWVNEELGYTLDIQKIIINSDKLENFTIEECLQKTLSLSNEGPHIEMNELLQLNSKWRKLNLNNEGKIIESNEELVWEKFPDINIDELKLKVKNFYGDEWYYLMSEIKTLEDIQNYLDINRYLLRISGKRKDNGQKVTKIIIVEYSMGC